MKTKEQLVCVTRMTRVDTAKWKKPEQEGAHCVIVPVHAMEKCQTQRKRKTVFTRGEDKDTDSIDKIIQTQNGHYT